MNRDQVAHPVLDTASYRALQDEADWELPIEHLGGEAVVIPPLGPLEHAARGEVRYLLRHWQQRHDDDGTLMMGSPVELGGEGCVVADLAYRPFESLPDVAAPPGRRVPDLIIFVQRAGSPDQYEELRRQACLAAGVRDVWTVDPRRQRVTTPHLGERRDKDMLMSPALNRFHISAFHPFLTRPGGPVSQNLLHRRLTGLLTEAGVPTAVLIGSVARKEEEVGSDVDLLLDLTGLLLQERHQLEVGIEEATGRAADLKSLKDALELRAPLIEDAIQDGVPLIDHDSVWAAVVADKDAWTALAARQRAESKARLAEVLKSFTDGDKPERTPDEPAWWRNTGVLDSGLVDWLDQQLAANNRYLRGTQDREGRWTLTAHRDLAEAPAASRRTSPLELGPMVELWPGAQPDGGSRWEDHGEVSGRLQ